MVIFKYLGIMLPQKGTYTLIGFHLCFPYRWLGTHAFHDPYTKNICIGVRKRHFSIYVRLRRVLRDPIDFMIGTFVTHDPILQTALEWEDI